ncbi:MAG: hypothetical protein KF812_05300 [Fimbriimonadaceae bacterium]|nr:hypothetical protein [Fimbriimonadaceae bacterium]
MNRFADIALLLAPDDPYAGWYREALLHAGIPFQEIKEQNFSRLPEFSLLILGGPGSFTESKRNQVSDWCDVNQGRIVACGGTWGLDVILGVGEEGGRNNRVTIQPGSSAERLWPVGAKASYGYRSARLEPKGAQVALKDANGKPLVTRNPRGLVIAPDLGATMALLLLGRAVEGSTYLGDDKGLFGPDDFGRVDDGTHLAHPDDRGSIEGVEFPIHERPHVDTMREIFLRSVVEACDLSGRSLALPWYWPGGADACAAVSVDVDDLNIEHLLVTVSSLQRFGMPATWMIPVPGVPQDAFRAIRRIGHAIGVLFRGERDTFSADQLKVQQSQIARASGSAVTACRSVEGHWHRRTALYEFMAEIGLQYSCNKGPRQPGTTGFPFGTCHPFAPVLHGDRHLEVFEVPFSLFKPGFVSPDRAMEPLFNQVVTHHGVMHMAHNTASVAQKDREKIIQEFLMRTRQFKLANMQLDQLVEFETGRRSLRIRQTGHALSITSDREMSDLSILVSQEDTSVESKGNVVRGLPVKRFGRHWTQFQFDLERKESTDLTFRRSQSAA